ncbi:hypothetical protein V1504DRAFT_464105 [Lipomyces starkeyi]
MMERIRVQIMLSRAERLKDIAKLRRDRKRITEAATKILQKSVSLAVYCDPSSGVPCAHAVAAISFAGRDYVDFVDDHFKVGTFESTYARGIHAISTVSVTEDDDSRTVGPPNTRRPPGRPHKKRVRTEDIGTSRKRVTCSRCHKQLGHNASTCREPLEE